MVLCYRNFSLLGFLTFRQFNRNRAKTIEFCALIQILLSVEKLQTCSNARFLRTL